MKFYKVSFFLLVQVAVLFGGGKKTPKVAITYDFSGGRLGDNLLSYMHAKWLSYKYNIPLVYRPFNYAEQFAFSSEEMAMEDFKKKYVRLRLKNEEQLSVKSKKKRLYVVPYFPESSYELTPESTVPCRVNWEDQRFLVLLKQAFRIKKSFQMPSLPENTITVAMHVRRGGSFEAIKDYNDKFFAKFPRDEFYMQGLGRLYEVLGQQSLYVYIFTDDQHPECIVQKFAKECEGKNIQFACRNEKNDHNYNVMEDFFAMMQFDCLVRSDSNFSLCVSKLKKFLIEIAPADYQNYKNVKLIPAFSLKMRGRYKGLSLGDASFGKDWQEIVSIKYT